MAGRDDSQVRPVAYCLVPCELALKLHEPLRRHFAVDPAIEVVVERRSVDRRETERRTAVQTVASEQRGFGGSLGRRIGDRRAQAFAVVGPALPRKARPFADQLVFIERLEPSLQELEDRDTAALVMRIQSGERELFSAIYMRYFNRIYAYMRILLRDTHAAEDATQEIFARLLAALPRYDRSRGHFRTWLFVVVRNFGIDTLRESARLPVIDSEAVVRQADERSPYELPGLDWLSDRELVLFVERLPLAQRQVLVLRYMLDLEHAEIAAVLGRSREDVRALHSRALRFLGQRLAAVGRAPERRGTIRALSRISEARVLRNRRYSLRPHRSRNPLMRGA